MAKLPSIIKDFAAQTGVDTSDWQVTQTSRRLLLSGIRNRAHADRLHRFLTEHEFMASTIMSDKTGTVWTVIARPITVTPAETGPTRRRRWHHPAPRTRSL